jgi:hypothetical protein
VFLAAVLEGIAQYLTSVRCECKGNINTKCTLSLFEEAFGAERHLWAEILRK